MNDVAQLGTVERREPKPNGADTPPEFSDEALALTFADRHQDELRYVAAWSRWFIWDGKCWGSDETLRAFDLARAVCRDAAAKCNNPSTRAKIASAKTVAAILSLTRADRLMAATVDQWDRDIWLLNTPAGVVDLRTGEIKSHRRDDYMTKITGVAPEGDCPIWRKFLDRVTAGNAELQQYLQRLAGYALTGSTKEHVLPFAHGGGGNGKGTFIAAIAGCMGDYHKTAPIETFAASNTDRHPTDLARLRGARLVTSQETEEGRRWAESRIKSLTGGDRIAARFMRADYFEFDPQFTLLIAGNHKPGLRSVDEAIRRRFHLIPFAVTIPADERDTDLGETLKAEWPGILAWMIEGTVDWMENGLRPPEIVRTATDVYLETQDAISTWIDEGCERDSNAWELGADLFASWKRWAEGTGEFVVPRTRLFDALETRGIHAKRQGNTGKRGFTGVKLIREQDESAWWNR